MMVVVAPPLQAVTVTAVPATHLASQGQSKESYSSLTVRLSQSPLLAC
jgi:hypothetical protein